MDILPLLGRNNELFSSDIEDHASEISDVIKNASFLVIGAAGSIGAAVAKEIFSHDPKKLHLVDISENNLVETVRQLRSSTGYISGDFKTFCIDCGGPEFDTFLKHCGPYDFVLNLSAMKHVRSEKDPYSLYRMIQVNIFNTISTLRIAQSSGSTKYFCVSTDKATNPVNLMGASKRVMEMFLARESQCIDVSTARFANVAFSDGSLLHGFRNRLLSNQPITAPNDVRRYFITPKESGELCLLATLLGQNMETFFPKLNAEMNLTYFTDIAFRFLHGHGYEPFECNSEEEARSRTSELIKKRKWPVYFFNSDTTGEKFFEEFYADDEEVNFEKFKTIGIINNHLSFDAEKLKYFEEQYHYMVYNNIYDRQSVIRLFDEIVDNFNHTETGKFLDDRM